MPSIEWTAARQKELSEWVPDGEPVVILNLLRYCDSLGPEKNDLTGRQAYERYSQATLPVLMEVGGRPLWSGQVRFLLVGPEGERWDEAILVGYPTLSAFERMMSDPRHEAEVAYRTAALEDSRVIVMVVPRTVSLFAWWMSKISTRFRWNGADT
jgi:uncharacterized protein (DUF1330 family)